MNAMSKAKKQPTIEEIASTIENLRSYLENPVVKLERSARQDIRTEIEKYKRMYFRRTQSDYDEQS